MRRADAAVVVSRLHKNLTEAIIKREPYRSVPFTVAMELLSIMSLVVLTTKEGHPLNRTQIAVRLSIPRTTVFRRLRTLMESGRVTTATSPHLSNETIYLANFDHYDEVITPDVIQDWHNLAVGAAHDLGELRAALAPVYERGSIPPKKPAP